jgi:hypothetical protein
MSQKIRSLVSASLVLATLALAGSALAAPGQPHGARALPSLTQEQRAKLDAAAEAEHKARGELRVALAAQVERGQINRAAVAPQLAAEKLAEANARNVKDATLTAEQKAELAKMRAAKHDGKKGHKGHAKEGEGHHGGGANGHGLNLTPEQKKQIAERMKAEPAGDRGVDRMVDRLDATAPVLTPAQRTELAGKLRRQ